MEDSVHDQQHVARWRIEMLARNSGFPTDLEPDKFGFRFSGPNLNGKSVSIRADGRQLVMHVPRLVAEEMRKEVETGSAPFHVSPDGLIRFNPDGAQAEQPIKRVAALMRALPDTPLAIYREKTRTMPETTEVERIAIQRVGQDIFRAALEDYWGGKCALTGVEDRQLLRASHIKPWADCDSDEERLDVYNGLLLAAHLDAAFDAFLMSFDEQGRPLWSPRLSPEALNLLQACSEDRLALTDAHQAFVDHHRARFRENAR